MRKELNMSVGIVTDSNSGITEAEAEELGIFLIPMSFTIDDKKYYEGVDLTPELFFKKQTSGSSIFTSQPSVGEVIMMFDLALESYDEIVHIPMSSGLSGAYQTAALIAEEDRYAGKVHVVDNKRISVTQKMDVLNAIELAKKGKSGNEIKCILEKNRYESSIYISIDCLDYLKKGGRLTPAAAALGSLLKIKPILTIQGEKLDKFSHSRTMGKAKSVMIEAVKSDIETRFSDVDYEVVIAYTTTKVEAEEYINTVENAFLGRKVHICDPLSLGIACHTGPNSIGLAVVKKLEE